MGVESPGHLSQEGRGRAEIGVCEVEDTIQKQATLFARSHPKTPKEQGSLTLSEGL